MKRLLNISICFLILFGTAVPSHGQGGAIIGAIAKGIIRAYDYKPPIINYNPPKTSPSIKSAVPIDTLSYKRIKSITSLQDQPRPPKLTSITEIGIPFSLLFGDGLSSPLNRESAFRKCYRTSPVAIGFRIGLDLIAKKGDAITCSLPEGVIQEVRKGQDDNSTLIFIRNESNTMVYIGDFSPLVDKGQLVKASDIIGKMKGKNLYWEIWQDFFAPIPSSNPVGYVYY